MAAKNKNKLKGRKLYKKVAKRAVKNTDNIIKRHSKHFKKNPEVEKLKEFGKKLQRRASKPAKLAKKRTKKGLARRVVGKLGLPGKIAVGASIAYDVAKSIPRGKKKPLAKGKKCKTGESVVRVGGKTYCMGKPKKR